MLRSCSRCLKRKQTLPSEDGTFRCAELQATHNFLDPSPAVFFRLPSKRWFIAGLIIRDITLRITSQWGRSGSVFSISTEAISRS